MIPEDTDGGWDEFLRVARLHRVVRKETPQRPAFSTLCELFLREGKPTEASTTLPNDEVATWPSQRETKLLALGHVQTYETPSP